MPSQQKLRKMLFPFLFRKLGNRLQRTGYRNRRMRLRLLQLRAVPGISRMRRLLAILHWLNLLFRQQQMFGCLRIRLFPSQMRKPCRLQRNLPQRLLQCRLHARLCRNLYRFSDPRIRFRMECYQLHDLRRQHLIQQHLESLSERLFNFRRQLRYRKRISSHNQRHVRRQRLRNVYKLRMPRGI